MGELAEESAGFCDSLVGDLDGAGFGVGDGVEAEFVGVAGGAEVGDFSVGEVDADTVGVVDVLDGGEACLSGEDLGEPGFDGLKVRWVGGGEALDEGQALGSGEVLEEGGAGEAAG